MVFRFWIYVCKRTRSVAVVFSGRAEFRLDPLQGMPGLVLSLILRIVTSCDRRVLSLSWECFIPCHVWLNNFVAWPGETSNMREDSGAGYLVAGFAGAGVMVFFRENGFAKDDANRSSDFQ